MYNDQNLDKSYSSIISVIFKNCDLFQNIIRKGMLKTPSIHSWILHLTCKMKIIIIKLTYVNQKCKKVYEVWVKSSRLW